MADYKVTDTELTSIANAIRTKGGTQAPLEFPTGFVSAVQEIPTGGGTTDANDVTYDSSETYDSGTVGAALNEQRNTLNHKADVIYDTASGDIASFPDGADGLPVKDLIVSIEPVQDTSGGDPSPTHICPISGWTGANVSRTGKNLLPKGSSTSGVGVTFTVSDDGTVTANGTTTDTAFCNAGRFVLPAGSYILNGCPTNSSGITMDIRNARGGSGIVPGADIGNGLAFTLAKETTGVVNIRIPSGVTVTNMVFKPMIRFASVSDSTFEPYSGTTLPISWQSSAGTVYGGTLDVTNWVLTADMAIIDLGTLVWLYQSASNRFIANISTAKKIGTWNSVEILCEQYKVGIPTASSADKICGINDGNFYVKDTSFSDASTFKTAMSGVQLCYELAQSQTYQLTPQEVEILTLYGTNNIWADCGPVSVDYPADTKLYIQKINAPTDDDMIADAQIASGKYFIVNNNLYISTAAILAGDPIKPGTNCTLTNLAAALNALNS